MRVMTGITFVGAGLLAACTDSGDGYTPVLDGAPNAAFQSDLSACQTLAGKQFGQQTLGASAIGAGVGAILAEADGEDALGGAVAGSLAGGVAGAVDVSDRREAIIIECLKGRGHAVVG